MSFLILGYVLCFFISVSVVGVILILGNLSGNASINNESAYSLSLDVDLSCHELSERKY
jgi:ABC-type sulfate transport system permease component